MAIVRGQPVNTTQNDRFRDEAERMRRDFDRLFATPDPPPPAETGDFVGVLVGGRPFALRVAELARIEACRKIVPLPGGRPPFLGLTSLRGRLVPVFDLETVLGLPPTVVVRRWVAVCENEAPLGFVFGELDGYLRVPQSDVLGVRPELSGPQAHQAVREAGGVRPVIHLPSLRARLSSHTETRKP
jgi:purine-binding chemotaxis protein CheW